MRSAILVLYCLGAFAAVWAQAGPLPGRGSRGGPPRLGTIRGYVFALSRALAGAKVYAGPIGVALGTAIPEAMSDGKGHFEIRNLKWGAYAVTAKKISAGYPGYFGANRTMYGEPAAPRALVSPRTPVAEVIVRLGSPAATLAVNQVDAVTGTKLSGVYFVMRLASKERVWLSGSQAAPEVLIPAERRVLLTIDRPGYRPWHKTIRMRSGTRRTIALRLEPLPASP